MSRKHFEALAAAIREAYEAADERHANGAEARRAIAFTAGKVARACADSNPRFDDKRFLAACGINS